MAWRRLLAVGAALVLAGSSAGAAADGALAAAKRGKVYEPPYRKGPTGGDEWNYVHADRRSGEMAIFRLFPGVPPVVGCYPEPSAGWGNFTIKHRVARPVSAVKVHFDAALDPYAWVTVGARDARGRWLGVRKRQGPHLGAGRLTARLHDRPRRGETITVEFGLQLGDACPQVGSALATFTSVRVKT